MTPVRLALAVSLLASGCVGPRGVAKAQETAGELNTNTRFGRMEMAAESIAPAARAEFFEHRKGWGNAIRIADTDLAGVKPAGRDDVEISVRVAWYRIDEGDLHTTTLRQKWHQYTEDWRLTEESRTDGDLGLLGEKLEAKPEAPRRKPARFPSIKITGAPPPEEAEQASAPNEPNETGE